MRNVAEAVRFYVETLGLKLVDEHDEASATIDAGDGFLIMLVAGRRPTNPTQRALTLYSKVALADCVAVLENRGVVFHRDSDTALRFIDPDGNVLVLAERARSGTEG